ncbi:MAG: tellurite resistance TerB family protein [Cyanobacteria bacterium MAG IRC4_bin_6]|nr:tellurite resistance TerB family protein [Cyanobacteria bacterium MAG IRC4_bin_6]
METGTAFAAIALAAVASDGVCTREEARALRRDLEFRYPYVHMDETAMGTLFDQLLRRIREDGHGDLMAEAAGALNRQQQLTAFAVACNLVRSDYRTTPEEEAFLEDLAQAMDLDAAERKTIPDVLTILYRDALQPHPTSVRNVSMTG